MIRRLLYTLEDIRRTYYYVFEMDPPLQHPPGSCQRIFHLEEPEVRTSGERKQAERLFHTGLCLRTYYVLQHAIHCSQWKDLVEYLKTDQSSPYRQGLQILTFMALGTLPVNEEDFQLLTDVFTVLLSRVKGECKSDKHQELKPMELIETKTGILHLMEKAYVQCGLCRREIEKKYDKDRIRQLLKSPHDWAESWCRSCQGMFLDLFAHGYSHDIDCCHIRMLASVNISLHIEPEQLKVWNLKEVEQTFCSRKYIIVKDGCSTISFESYFMSGCNKEVKKDEAAQTFSKFFLERHKGRRFLINKTYQNVQLGKGRKCCEQQLWEYLQKNKKKEFEFLQKIRGLCRIEVTLTLEQEPCMHCRGHSIPGIEDSIKICCHKFQVRSMLPYESRTYCQLELLDRLTRPCILEQQRIIIQDQMQVSYRLDCCQNCRNFHIVAVVLRALHKDILLCLINQCGSTSCRENHCHFTNTRKTIQKINLVYPYPVFEYKH